MAQKDFVAIADTYAREALASPDYCKWAKLAAQRYIDDKQETGKGWYFDPAEANRACSFIELLPHVEGTWDTPNIVMHPAHVFATVNIFGFRKKTDKTRRFTDVLFAIARKNAKSTWAAGVLLYCQLMEGENGPKVISAATTGTQSRVIFNIAKMMVEKLPKLRSAFNVVPRANDILSLKNNGLFKPINAKASTQDGLNPSAVGIDEVHAHKTHDLINVLKSAAGARRQPLFLYTTTEGYETPGPWPELRHMCKQILEKVVVADHFWGIIYCLDKGDSEFDASKWIKANPLMDTNDILRTEIAKEAVEARHLPGKMAEFRIKRCNLPSSVAEGYIDLNRWTDDHGPFDMSALATIPAYAGLDLSSNRDIASLRVVWKVEDLWYTKGWRFVPEQAVLQRSERGTNIYQSWVESGLLIVTPGDVTDYSYIEKVLRELHTTLNLRVVAYDRWNSTELVNRLVEANIPMKEFIQGPKSYHPAMRALERAYINKKLRHENDPVLRWCASNLVARTDVNLNLAPDRRKSADKIDDIVALLMAVGAAITVEPEAREPQILFV